MGNKFGAKKVRYDGYLFDSGMEWRRYTDLRLLEAAGEVHDIEVHPKFDIIVNGIRVAGYEADFRYEGRDGNVHVEDVKGARTAVYSLKKKLIEALYGIRIEEITKEML